MSEIVRHDSPVQAPQGLAWDGATMWVTSAASGRLYAVDLQTRRIEREYTPPAEALGITHTGTDFRLILAPAIDEPDLELDYRYVYSFSPDAGFTERFSCPQNSGSFLAYTRGTLYLSQAWDKKIIELDKHGEAVRELHLDRRPVGMTIVDNAFYLVTVDDEWRDGRFERLGVQGDASSIETLRTFPFKPRSVVFDGTQFWTADRDNHALASFSI